MSLAWGAKVSLTFRDKVRAIAAQLLLPNADTDGASMLMACMAWESGRTFKPDVKNAAGSGAVGLIQFMPLTAKNLGTSVEQLVVMTAEEQLDVVARYFSPYRGRLHTLADIYMVILWPAAVGHPDSTVLWDEHTKPTTYKQNAGLDGDHDGQITKAEAAFRVHECYVEGLRPINVAV